MTRLICVCHCHSSHLPEWFCRLMFWHGSAQMCNMMPHTEPGDCSPASTFGLVIQNSQAISFAGSKSGELTVSWESLMRDKKHTQYATVMTVMQTAELVQRMAVLPAGKGGGEIIGGPLRASIHLISQNPGRCTPGNGNHRLHLLLCHDRACRIIGIGHLCSRALLHSLSIMLVSLGL